MFLEIDKKKENQIIAISDKGDCVSYKDAVSFSNQVSTVVPERSLVFSFCHNQIGSLMGYVAFLSNHIVPLLLSADLDMQLIQDLLETYKPNFLWIPKDMELEGIQGKSVLEAYDYKLIHYCEEKIKLYKDLALLLTTSGSTGSAKLVRQTYTNIESNAKSIATYLDLDETERPITMLPMNYTYGLSVINSHLLVGATILMTDESYAQKGFWNFFKEKGATSIVGVPFTYEILKKLRFFRMELPSLRYMTQAGGKLLPELHREYAQYAMENHKRFYVMYGQTEATARMSYLPYEKSLEKYGSMGIAIPGGTFHLIDVDGNTITEPEQVGELVYEGPNVTLGYAQCQEDLSKGDERGGVLITGDMAKRDADGYYYIVGRKKRFLKIYGNRVNLDECERMIQGQFKDVECACVGEDDHMQIFVTKKDLDTEIIHFVSEKTGLNFKAFEVKYIADIPKNEAGKKQYKELY
ncbi:MAG: AMP-binding protein [Lachnospiraceae bacterium]